LDEIEKIGLTSYASLLYELSDLQGLGSREVSFRARRMLVRYRLPSFEQRKLSLEKELLTKDRIGHLIAQPSSIFDVLTACFFHNSTVVREGAMEVYLGRTFQAYLVKDLKVNPNEQSGVTLHL